MWLVERRVPLSIDAIIMPMLWSGTSRRAKHRIIEQRKRAKTTFFPGNISSDWDIRVGYSENHQIDVLNLVPRMDIQDFHALVAQAQSEADTPALKVLPLHFNGCSWLRTSRFIFHYMFASAGNQEEQRKVIGKMVPEDIVTTLRWHRQMAAMLSCPVNLVCC